MQLTPSCAPLLQFVLVKMECRRYKMQQTSAWALENELSPRGEKEYTEVSDGINYHDFTINIVDRGNEAWECSLRGDWSTRRRRIRSSSQRSQQRDRILENALVDWINVMLFRVSTWPRLW